MSEITSELLEVSVDTDATVKIDSKLPEPQLDITKSITAEIQPENYVLTSGGMYTGNMTGATPTWLLNAIQQQLTTGDGNVTSVLNDMQLLLDDLQLGVNQAISQIENTNVSMSALETSLSSQIGANSADILDVYATRVTADEAQTIATTAIGTTFNGNVDAYIANLASVYTAPGSATATNISTLQTSYNDQTARIDTVESVTISNANSIDSLVNVTIADLQSQIDGEITTWFEDYVPDVTNEPWLSWESVDTLNGNTIEQDKHTGDLFYDTSTGAGYRFTKVGEVFGWGVITDTAITEALANAANAQTTADGKITTFYQAGTPTAEGVGDLWIDSDNNNKYHRWNGTMWEYLRDSSEDAAINQGISDALSAASAAQATADGRIISYYQATPPATAVEGDIWFDTDDGNKIYTYDGANWLTTQDSQIGQALLDAADAQSTADGKRTVFYQDTEPVTTDIGDLWVNETTKVVKTWSGSVWVDTTNTKTDTAYTWSAEASKLITSPDGSVTGWSFGDGSNTQSYFKVQATNFSVSDGTTGYTPFLIDGTNIKFNGLVEFSNVTGSEDVLLTGEAAADINANTTTIDGGKITTNSLNANTIIAGGSISSPNIYGGYINGSIIEGTQIIGSVIKGSFIDLTTTIYLTNWQSITDINTIPVEYRDNFAKDSATGDYIVDSEGYYRLPGTLNLNSPAYSYTNNITKAAQSFAIPGWAVPIYSYNSYTINTLNRVVTNTFTADYVSPGEVIGFTHNAFRLGLNCFWEYSSVFKIFDTTYELFCSFTTNGDGNHMYNINAYVKINGVTQSWTASTTDVKREWAPSTFNKNGITYDIYFGFGYIGSVIMELSAYIQFQGTTLNINNGFVSDQVIFEYLSGYITHGDTGDNSSSGDIIANFPILQITPIF